MNDRLTDAADYLDQLEPMFEPDGLTPPDAVKAGALLAREYQRFADPTKIDTAWLQGRGAEQAQGSSRLDIHDGNNRLSWWPNGRTSLNGALIHERQFTRGQFRRICELLDLRLVPQDI